MRLAFIFALGSWMLLPLPAWSGINCSFQVDTGVAIIFGQLDPSDTNPVQISLSNGNTVADTAGGCQGGAPNPQMTIAIKDGVYTRQLKKGTDSITYTVTGLPISLPKPGNTGWTNWGAGVKAQIQWNAFANAPAGDYQDIVVIEVTP